MSNTDKTSDKVFSGRVGELDYDNWSGNEETYEDGVLVSKANLYVDENGWKASYYEKYKNNEKYVQDCKSSDKGDYIQKQGRIDEQGKFTGKVNTLNVQMLNNDTVRKSHYSETYFKNDAIQDTVDIESTSRDYSHAIKKHYNNGSLEEVWETMKRHNGHCYETKNGVVWDEWEQSDGKKNGVEKIYDYDEGFKLSKQIYWKNGVMQRNNVDDQTHGDPLAEKVQAIKAKIREQKDANPDVKMEETASTKSGVISSQHEQAGVAQVAAYKKWREEQKQ